MDDEYLWYKYNHLMIYFNHRFTGCNSSAMEASLFWFQLLISFLFLRWMCRPSSTSRRRTIIILWNNCYITQSEETKARTIFLTRALNWLLEIDDNLIIYWSMLIKARWCRQGLSWSYRWGRNHCGGWTILWCTCCGRCASRGEWTHSAHPSR